jgi:hypothetical protein
MITQPESQLRAVAVAHRVIRLVAMVVPLVTQTHLLFWFVDMGL